jgi:hypothetical protein
MTPDLGCLSASFKSGEEPFRRGPTDLGFDLLSFWRWAFSDLLNNTTRGMLAEFLVARALGIRVDTARSAWVSYDLQSDSGLKIEVKSSSYVQGWHQKRYSRICFDIAPATRWNPLDGSIDRESKRQADLYVFALLDHKDKATVDPMNVDQWRFFVVPTSSLDKLHPTQLALGLKTLEALCKPVAYTNLRLEVGAVATTLGLK